MRVTYDDLKNYVKNIVDGGKLPYATLLSGGWERWFQMELAVQILNGKRDIRLDTESSLVYPTEQRNDIVVLDSRSTSCSISYSYEIKCQTMNSSVVNMSQKVVKDIIKSFDVISDVHCTEIVAMFCDWDNTNSEFFCQTVFNTLAGYIVHSNITRTPEQNIKCVSYENINGFISRGNRALSNIMFVYIDVKELIHNKQILKEYLNLFVPAYEIQNEAIQCKYGAPRNWIRYYY